MFDRDRFLEDCKTAVGDGQRAVRELVAEAVSNPAAIVAELGEPTAAGVYALYQGDDMTVINFIWAPYMTLIPHNHNMAAAIGIYGGLEDNLFWRRIKEDPGKVDQKPARRSRRPAPTASAAVRWRRWGRTSSIPWPTPSPSLAPPYMSIPATSSSRRCRGASGTTRP